MSVIVNQPAEWTPELRLAAARQLRVWADEVPNWPQPQPGEPFVKRLDWFTMKELA